MKNQLAVSALLLATIASGCGRQSTVSSPAPATPAPTSTTTAPAAQPGAVAAARVRPRPSPDSLAKLRAVRVNEVLASIAGKENQPATAVFKNVQFLKNVTARELIDTMNTYGRALGWNCTNCHVPTDYSSDSKHDKQLARIMQQMTLEINRDQMPKLKSRAPVAVNCMTCHRGVNIPNDSIDLRNWPAASRPPL